MNSPVFKKQFVVFRRVAELLLPTIGFSALITILNMMGLVVKRSSVFFLVLALAAAFTILNFTNLRKCYFDLRNKKLFFVLNFLSHFIFAGINFAVLMFAKNEVYTWLFALTKGLKIIDVQLIYSVLLFHFFQLVCIIASTIGMGWIFDTDDEEEW